VAKSRFASYNPGVNGRLITFLLAGVVAAVAAAVAFNATISDSLYSAVQPLLNLGR